jgi:tRNA-uridine 2-sulfurtransferase
MKAIVLISGGLDSILAGRMVKEQGIEIIPLNFKIPFCHRKKDNFSAGKPLDALVREYLGSNLTTIDISNEFLKLLDKPAHGFGSNMNPCIDCKILMLRKAKELMLGLGARFVVTGEVLGQRPMSQHRQALMQIAKEAGLEGLVLRPLSARLLGKTIIENEGLVDSRSLLDFNGRSRKPQVELAKSFNIKEYAQPAGGCLLTDSEFAKRLKDIIKHKELNLDNAGLLKIGRHFRISPEAKLVVGRDEGEDKELGVLAKDGDWLFYPDEQLAGPTSLGRGNFSKELIKLSCEITCHYCDLPDDDQAGIVYKSVLENKEYRISVSKMTAEELAGFRIRI